MVLFYVSYELCIGKKPGKGIQCINMINKKVMWLTSDITYKKIRVILKTIFVTQRSTEAYRQYWTSLSSRVPWVVTGDLTKHESCKHFAKLCI